MLHWMERIMKIMLQHDAMVKEKLLRWDTCFWCWWLQDFAVWWKHLQIATQNGTEDYWQKDDVKNDDDEEIYGGCDGRKKGMFKKKILFEGD